MQLVSHEVGQLCDIIAHAVHEYNLGCQGCRKHQSNVLVDGGPCRQVLDTVRPYPMRKQQETKGGEWGRRQTPVTDLLIPVAETLSLVHLNCDQLCSFFFLPSHHHDNNCSKICKIFDYAVDCSTLNGGTVSGKMCRCYNVFKCNFYRSRASILLTSIVFGVGGGYLIDMANYLQG